MSYSALTLTPHTPTSSPTEGGTKPAKPRRVLAHYERVVRVFKVDGSRGVQTIVRLDRFWRNPEDATLGLNETAFQHFWEDHGIGCLLCARDERATMELEDHSFTIITACPHRRQDDSFVDETVNNAVGSLPPNPEQYNPVAGAVVVIKHRTIPDIPDRAEYAPLLNIRPEDIAAVNNFVRAWALDFDDLTAPLPNNTFSLARVVSGANENGQA
uniref:Uncharacterized protein n=1 Tax=Mycena chlorophos TaxID=658473 RepID=A0ABQ0L1A4_MYCCL|nr:predicted protein [Mycena chlorophos]